MRQAAVTTLGHSNTAFSAILTGRSRAYADRRSLPAAIRFGVWRRALKGHVKFHLSGERSRSIARVAKRQGRGWNGSVVI